MFQANEVLDILFIWDFKLESFCVGSTTFFQQLWTIKNCQIKKSVGMFMAFILYCSGVKAAKHFHREWQKIKVLEVASFRCFLGLGFFLGSLCDIFKEFVEGGHHKRMLSIFESVSLFRLEVLSTIH